MKKKNKFLTFVFSLIPGAAHMYLGLQKQGIQIMLMFIMCLFLSDWLRTALFAAFTPVIWFFSFFDAMNKSSSEEPVEDSDIMLLSWLKGEGTLIRNKGKLIGYTLIVIGGFLICERVVFPGLNLNWQFREYFKTAIVTLLMIAGGIKLVAGSRNTNSKGNGDMDA